MPLSLQLELEGFVKNNIRFFFFAVLALIGFLSANDRYTAPLRKASTSVADYVHYTTVGQLGLTITNFGVLGEGYNNPDQPSCMYKQYPDNIKRASRTYVLRRSLGRRKSKWRKTCQHRYCRWCF